MKPWRPRKMKIALVQMKHSGSMNVNLQKSLDAIGVAAAEHADIVLFPEVHLTEFFPQYEGMDVKKYGIELDSEIVQSFQKICKEKSICAVPNLYLKEKNRYYDSSIFIDKHGEIVGLQKMVHVAQASQFYEQDYYTPSDEGFQVFDTEYGRIGIVVCFDRHYPESIRTEALKGADFIMIPTVNTKCEPLEMFEWEVRVQAFQNSVAIAMCNRVGSEDAMSFAGESMVVDAYGNVIAKAGDQEEILYAEIDLRESEKIRNSKPYTQLRRKGFYE